MKPIANMPVMPKQCATCPFRMAHAGQIEVMATVMGRILNSASQICHHPRTKGKKETHLCRGARDIQIRYFHRIGFLDEPTDEAWAKKWKEIQLTKRGG